MFNHQDIREDVVVVQEKMKLNPQFIKTKTSGEEYATHDGGYTLKLQRNLRDDTFNIMFKDPYYDANTKHFLSQLTDADIFANVNGVETSLSKMHAHSRTSSNGKNENSFFVHRSMINNIKFRDIKSATFGIKNITYPNDLAYRMSIYPQFEALRDNIRISKDKVLDIQTINAMTINIKNPHATNGNANYKNEEMLVTKSYTHTLLVPRELRRMGKNVTVFDVFVYNDILKKVDGYGVESSENDYALKKGEIKTTSFKNKLNLVVNDIHGDTTNGIIEKISPWEDKRKHVGGWIKHSPVKYVGSFNMFNQTSYDYEKGESVVGSSSTSREGEIIPYSLKGGYYRESTLGVNEIYKKIKVLQTFTNLKPLLQPDVGSVRLDIETEKETNTEHIKYDIDPKILIKQKDYIFPLEGLERISKPHGTKHA